MPIKKSLEKEALMPLKGMPSSGVSGLLVASSTKPGSNQPIQVNVPVTVTTGSKEPIADRVRWSILSAIGAVLTWPFRLVARIVERIVDESASAVVKVLSVVVIILIAPLALWLGFEIAVGYMKNRDVHGAFIGGLNALQDLWSQFLNLFGGTQ